MCKSHLHTLLYLGVGDIFWVYAPNERVFIISQPYHALGNLKVETDIDQSGRIRIKVNKPIELTYILVIYT